MSFIAKNPLMIPEIDNAPSVPKGTRGLIAKTDGWYDVDSDNNVKKIVTGESDVSPEMFGAVGDGETDDSEAIQAAIDTRKPVKFMNKTYKISKTLNLVGSSGFNFRGLYLDGNNCTIITTVNEPIFLLTLCGNQLSNFTLTYDGNIFNKTNNPYTSDIVKIMSYGKRAVRDDKGNIVLDDKGKTIWYDLGKNSGRHRFTNVNIQSPLRWEKDAITLHYGNGFTIVAQGHHAYSYQNIFTGCQVEAMHIAINLVRDTEEGENSFGINGNEFDVTSWANDIYLKGNPGGCYFSGCVQCSDLKKDDKDNILNQYLIEEVGSMGNNTFDNYFYDVAWDNNSAKRRQKVIDIKGYANHFTSYLPQTSVEGNYFNNTFHFTNANNKQILLPSSGYGGAILNGVNIMPFGNSLASLINDENHEVEFKNMNGYRYNSVENYKIKNLKTYQPTKVSYLFGDNSKGRGLYLQPTAEDNAMIITITGLNKVRINDLFIHSTGIFPIKSCTMEMTDSKGSTVTINGNLLQKDRTVASIIYTGFDYFSEIKLTISLEWKEDDTNLCSISKISGCAFGATHGLIEGQASENSANQTNESSSASNSISNRNAVKINNLSSINHDLVVKTRGKNIVNIATSKLLSFSNSNPGYEFTALGNNSFKVSKIKNAASESTNWDRYGFVVGTKKDLYGKTITISTSSKGNYNVNDELINDEFGSYMQIYSCAKKEGILQQNQSNAPFEAITLSRAGYDYVTFTVDDKYKYEYVGVLFGTGTITEIGGYRKFENVMFEISDTANPYVEPIDDISAVEVRRYKKNLIPSDIYNTENWVANGENGYIYKLDNIQFESLVLNAKASDVFTNEKLYFVHSLDNGTTWEISDDTEYKLVDNDSVISITIAPTEGAVYALWTKNLTLLEKITNIMLEVGDTPSVYDNYLEPTVYNPDENGVIRGLSNEIYPLMTLVSNTNNVILDVEYMTSNYREVDNSIIANRAISDGNGNVIAETYATQEYVDSKVSGNNSNSNITPTIGLTASASGTNGVLNLENISAIEHELKVNISSVESIDLSTVSVTRYSKNLYNYSGSNWVYTSIEEVNPSNGSITNKSRYIIPLDDIPNGELSITCKFDDSQIAGYIRLYQYTISEETGKYQISSPIHSFLYSGTIKGIYSFTKESGQGYLLWGTNENCVRNAITEFQIELGTPTEYEPYNALTIQSDADGKVKGLTSLYPRTVLSSNTEGVTITAEYLTTNYNKTIDDYINNKIKAYVDQALLSNENND